MYYENNDLREWTLDTKSFNTELERKKKLFEINETDIQFYSQQDEDKYIIQYLLKDKITDGTYLEIGGYDGITHSNTKTLEDYFYFNGILIEPQPYLFKCLQENRSSDKNEVYNCAVTNNDAEYIDFIGDNAEAGVIGDLNTNMNKFAHLTSYKVKNIKMKDILQNSKFNYIDFMIIDVEGSELSLLHSIDFSFPIFCIIIEAHSDQQEKNKIFGNYLSSNGFNFKERQRGNEVWINYNYFRQHLFNITK